MNICKASASKCDICGRLLWKPWHGPRVNEHGTPLGYNPGRKRDGKWVCWNGKACRKRAGAK